MSKAMTTVEVMRAVACMNRVDLKLVSDAVRERWNELSADAREELKVGDAVRFRVRHGALVEGTIIGFNRKNVEVRDTSTRRWRVAPTLLEKRTDAATREERS